MALINTAKSRLGLGGPSVNYTRPFTAKAKAILALSFGIRVATPIRGLVAASPVRGLVAAAPIRGLVASEFKCDG
jgi:hypothetical protein